MGGSKSSSKREVYSNYNPTSRNKKKTSSRQPNFTPKATGKEEPKKKKKKTNTRLVEGKKS